MNLSNISGVDKYILVDQDNKITTHNVQNPQKSAQTVLSCAKKSFTMGRAKNEFVVFPRTNKKSFFIFRVDNLYLGVVKKKNIDNKTLTNNILNFFKKTS